MSRVMIDPAVLPDKPNEWGDFIDLSGDGAMVRQRWLPGAFGRRKTISGVARFKITEDELQEEDDGRFSRTIIAGEALREPSTS